MTKEKKHAKFSASASSKWLNCAGSIEAESKSPKEKQSVFAEEGTTAHELADLCLKNMKDASSYIGKEIKFEIDNKRVTKIIDEEMASFVQEYIDYVLSFEKQDSQLFTEDKVDFSNIAPEGFGTMDSAILDYETGVCHIFDLKYGKGVKVDAENNTQGQLYALGLYNELEVLDIIKKFVIHIVQPRIYNYSTWEISLKDLIKFGKFASQRANEALKPNPKRTPGEKQCQWCAAKASCKELMKFTEEVIKCEFDNLDPDVNIDNEISEKEIKNVLDNKKLIESFLKAVEEDAFNKLSNGEKIPGYKLVEGRKTTKWVDNSENILVKKLKDKAYNKKLIGITEGKKLLSKEDFLELTFKDLGNPIIAPESDKRKEITNIKDQFEEL